MKKIRGLCILYISLVLLSMAGCGNYPLDDKAGQAWEEFVNTITVSAAQPHKEANITLYYPDGSTLSYDFEYSSIRANHVHDGFYKTIYYLDGAPLFVCQNSCITLYMGNGKVEVFSGTYHIKDK